MANNKKTVKKEAKELVKRVKDHIVSTLAKDPGRVRDYDIYNAIAYSIRDKLIERWLKTQNTYYKTKAKRVYYLSLEFLAGRTLGNCLINMGMMDACHEALHELGRELEDIREIEWDAGLGNGGLGRLAACYLDSLATLEIPSYGYGIHYEYGIFHQKITDGSQVEVPDNWLRYGNPWEFARAGHLYRVGFHGRVDQFTGEDGRLKCEWVNTDDVMAMACDTPVPGYNNNHVINMRLWAARSSREFDLDYFNKGDYIGALENKMKSETLSKVLYPSDQFVSGKELRLKQQYFLVCATLQDIVRRHHKTEKDYSNFPNTVAIQLNDTHPVLAIPELMRILLDKENYEWEPAWDITVKTFGYTNHTLMPEALEKWPVSLMESLLPRHLQIIYEINRRLLEQAARTFPGDIERLKRISIIEEGKEKFVRMANLAIAGSHSVNGVSALHTELLRTRLFRDFDEIFPGRFNNKTNGVTPRRWLKKANPKLADLITEKVGEGWVTDLDRLRKLEPFAKDKDFRARWREAKHENKKKLAESILHETGVKVDPDSMFDIQVKRIHEYKRQLLNILHVITLYNRIKDRPKAEITPRTVVFGGKAAPSYRMAKLIIKLANSVADVVNSDKEVGKRLKVVFLPNYRVSLAEKIIPAADLSEQISTAGTEASGTGNMKFALNGALTIGTMDGANIEIREEVGKENIFIFGLTAEEIAELKKAGYDPLEHYRNEPELKRTIDMLKSGYFSPFVPGLFSPIADSLLEHGDPFFILADFNSYVKCQETVSNTFKNRDLWDKMSILNTARMGKFSSDRAVLEYAREIWNVKPVKVK